MLHLEYISVQCLVLTSTKISTPVVKHFKLKVQCIGNLTNNVCDYDCSHCYENCACMHRVNIRSIWQFSFPPPLADILMVSLFLCSV